MKKTLFFDADGVTIVERERFFSDRFSLEWSVPKDRIMLLFKNEFYKCVLGEMDLKEVLKKYVSLWGWKGSIDELLQYWWEGENKPNIPVLQTIDTLRSQGALCYLATDQEKYRAAYIMKNIGLENHLDGAFFSYELGISKSTPPYWERVLEILNINDPSTTLYWDDEIENIEAAQKIGIDARLYTRPEDISIDSL